MAGNKGKGFTIVIVDRDCRACRELAVMRVADREQLALAAGFTSVTRANARLLKLVRAGFLKRTFLGTHGSGRKAIYALSATGQALAGDGGMPFALRSSYLASGNLQLEHQLRINEVYLDVRHRKLPEGVSLVRFQRFAEGLHQSVPLIPDGYLELNVNGVVHPLFLEVDLGSESTRIWRTKVKRYLDLAIGGRFADIFRRRRFRVLVLTTTQRRLASLSRATAKHTAKIFRFSTLDGGGLFAPAWSVPATPKQKESLF